MYDNRPNKNQKRMKINVLLLSVLLFCGVAVAAPKAELWVRWEQHDPATTTQVDHTALTAFLKKIS